MMGDILAFRSSTPVIYIDGAHDSWYVNVRPCPAGVPTLSLFKSMLEAQRYAVDLQNDHGWAIDIATDCHGAA